MVSRDTGEVLDADEEDARIKARAERHAALVRDRQVAELRHMLSTEGGRAFMWRLLSECGLYASSYVGELPLAMARNEGKRHIGLWLLGELTAVDPLVYAKMQREAKVRADEEEKWK